MKTITKVIILTTTVLVLSCSIPTDSGGGGGSGDTYLGTLDNYFEDKRLFVADDFVGDKYLLKFAWGTSREGVLSICTDGSALSKSLDKYTGLGARQVVYHSDTEGDLIKWSTSDRNGEGRNFYTPATSEEQRFEFYLKIKNLDDNTLTTETVFVGQTPVRKDWKANLSPVTLQTTSEVVATIMDSSDTFKYDSEAETKFYLETSDGSTTKRADLSDFKVYYSSTYVYFELERKQPPSFSAWKAAASDDAPESELKLSFDTLSEYNVIKVDHSILHFPSNFGYPEKQQTAQPWSTEYYLQVFRRALAWQSSSLDRISTGIEGFSSGEEFFILF